MLPRAVLKIAQRARSMKGAPGLFETTAKTVKNSRTLGGLDVGVSRLFKWGGTGAGIYVLTTTAGNGVNNILESMSLENENYDPVGPFNLPGSPFYGSDYPNANNPMTTGQDQAAPKTEGEADILTLLGIAVLIVALVMMVKK